MSLLKKNRPFFIFLLKFVITYLVLSGTYALYLHQFDETSYEPDGITHMVAKHAVDLADLFGEEVFIKQHTQEASYRFFINGVPVARIVEGCNAVSVMILFVAFIVAFSSTFIRTALFIIFGILMLYILNIVRVSLLSAGYYYYPEYKRMLHDIVFPFFIYGVVFVLWILWIKKFSGNGKQDFAK